MQELVLWFEKTLGLHPQIQLNFFNSLLTIALLWLIQRLLLGLINKFVKNIENRYQMQKGIGYLFPIIGFLIIGRIWLDGMETLITFLGLLSAGVAIALKDPLMNIAGWLYILVQKPFEVSDRIEINGVAGDVIDIQIFRFSLMEIGNWVNADQSTGRVLHVPNGAIFTSVLSSYSQGYQYIWNELEVLITFESNWPKAKNTLEKIITKFSQSEAGKIDNLGSKTPQNYLLKIGKTTPIIYISVQNSGVLLTIRYPCDPHRRRSSTSTIWENILTSFENEPDIQFAYPTRRLVGSVEKNDSLKAGKK